MAVHRTEINYFLSTNILKWRTHNPVIILTRLFQYCVDIRLYIVYFLAFVSCFLYRITIWFFHSKYKSSIIYARCIVIRLYNIKQTKYTFCKEEHTRIPTRLLIVMSLKYTIPSLYIKSASWRWTLWFETCRRYKKLKIKILIIRNAHFFGLYFEIILKCTVQKKLKNTRTLWEESRIIRP